MAELVTAEKSRAHSSGFRCQSSLKTPSPGAQNLTAPPVTPCRELSHVKNGSTLNTSSEDGGGLYLDYSNSTLSNVVVADNQADTNGSGLYVTGASPRLIHTTLARNHGGDGSGLYVVNESGGTTVALTNTILASHSVGLTLTTGCTATLNGVLWYSNTANTGGDGILAVDNAINDNPAFALDGYHLTANSAAIDAGVEAGVTDDVDGRPRPVGRPDLGADEWGTRVFLPLVLRQ